jgi:hypothetical protein
MNVGDSITLSYGANTQTCTVGGTGTVGAQATATSIPISACTPTTWNYAYPNGTRITDTSSDATPARTECYDQQTTSSTVSGATFGSTPGLNFNEAPPAPGTTTAPANGMCQTMLFWVQEQTGGKNYCWYGNGAASLTGMCTAPISSNLSSGGTIDGTTTTLNVGALAGNVQGTSTHDSIVISEGNNKTTCSAQADAYIGATSITVSGCTPSNTFTTNAVVTDGTTLTTLNSDSTDTISNFDTAKSGNGRIPLYTVSSNGHVNNPSAIELNKHGDSGDTRVFYVGVYLAAPTGATQNNLQGISSTFGVTWHVDQ